MDRSVVPVLGALTAYQAQGQLPFTPPGHKQGRGPARGVELPCGRRFSARTCSRCPVWTTGPSPRVLERAEALMAYALGAEQQLLLHLPGNSLSVKGACSPSQARTTS